MSILSQVTSWIITFVMIFGSFASKIIDKGVAFISNSCNIASTYKNAPKTDDPSKAAPQHNKIISDKTPATAPKSPPLTTENDTRPRQNRDASRKEKKSTPKHEQKYYGPSPKTSLPPLVDKPASYPREKGLAQRPDTAIEPERQAFAPIPRHITPSPSAESHSELTSLPPGHVTGHTQAQIYEVYNTLLKKLPLLRLAVNELETLSNDSSAYSRGTVTAARSSVRETLALHDANIKGIQSFASGVSLLNIYAADIERARVLIRR